MTSDRTNGRAVDMRDGSTPTDVQVARRTCLSVPGSSEKMLTTAPALDADELVLDLEDAVALAAKADARDRVTRALAGDAYARLNTAVRVNAPGTPWCHADVIALAAAPRPPISIVLPKVESAGDLAFVDRLLDGAESAVGQSTPLRVQALIETAAGLARINEIAAASPRLDALILGYADLAASLGRSEAGARDLDGWRPAQEAVLTAAHAHGLQAIDGPYLGVSVDDAFVAAATRTRNAGFDGKWAIHPSQIAELNELFTPSPAELDNARAIIAALDAAERRDGRGAIALNGEMLDEALRVAALRTLARA
ncbi:MAG: citrate lyase subunit beta / citryl-CoA lyase [Baekduia sp.]|jgi:citrate lyase subunit beta/citryl-CoA lyase|nr:citrate lyase subunit beta / citryl-CoA lyase [Baekduia sp.]